MFRKTVFGLAAVAAVAAATLGFGANTADAKTNLSIAIGVPGYGVPYYAPRAYYAPPAYYPPAPYYGYVRYRNYRPCERVFVGYRKRWSDYHGHWVRRPVHRTVCY